MDHRTAVLTGTAEKYFLDELSAPEREEFEEHYFGCMDCAEAVRRVASFLEAAGPMVVPAEKLPAPKLVSSRPPSPPQWWRAGPQVSLAASLAFACLLGAAAYQGLVTVPRLRHEVRQTESLRAVPSYALTLSRSEPPIIVISPDDRYVLLALSQSSLRPYPAYRCQLQDTTGRALRAEVLRPRALGEELEILLPVTGLPAGGYVLAVEGVPASSASPPPDAGDAPARYVFTLQRS